VIARLYSFIAVTSLFPERLQGQRDSALDEEEEWEIVKIVGKRRTRSYNVRWKNTWLLPRSKLGNAQELLASSGIRLDIALVLRRAAPSPFGLAADKQPSSDTSEPKTLFFRSNRVILMRLHTTSSHKAKISTICTNRHYANITTT